MSQCLTVNIENGWVAEASGGNVLGHAGVVALVRHPRPHDEEVAGAAALDEVGVGLWVDFAAVFEPGDLRTRPSLGRKAAKFDLLALRFLLGIWRGLKLLLQIWNRKTSKNMRAL